MTRSCAQCGLSYAASRPSATYCGDTCRKRAQRAQKAAQSLPNAPERPETPSDAPEAPLVAAVRRELSQADRLDTTAGQVALVLASRVSSGNEQGAAVASLSKQLREAMAEAMANAVTEASPLDEIRARRDARRNAG
ncbi:MAG: hypothetical protein NVSMB16_14520 [Acidimicrobiales bacterium]